MSGTVGDSFASGVCGVYGTSSALSRRSPSSRSRSRPARSGTGGQGGFLTAAPAALLNATPAQNIFVDENSSNPVLGPCSRAIHGVIRPWCEDIVDAEIWIEADEPTRISRTESPYSDLSEVHDAPSHGRIAVMHTANPTGRERDTYDDDGCTRN